MYICSGACKAWISIICGLLLAYSSHPVTEPRGIQNNFSLAVVCIHRKMFLFIKVWNSRRKKNYYVTNQRRRKKPFETCSQTKGDKKCTTKFCGSLARQR
jgi:hypothetical protein